MDEHTIPKELPAKLFTLVLVSHSHAPPLLPAPHLTFDLRKVSNPPKHVRDSYDGRSKRLREHMLANEDFCALLETAQARIEEQMSAFAEQHRESFGKQSMNFSFISTRWKTESYRVEAGGVNKVLTTDTVESPEDQPPQLLVGCFCELGRHRSVAFVEELSRRRWPSDWDAEVCHRDVDQIKGKGNNQRHKQMRRDNQKFVGLDKEG